jgi:stage III sporulation protein AG
VKEKLTELIKSKNMVKVLFIAGIAGILLIFASSMFSEEKQEKAPIKNSEFSQEEYCHSLEEDIKQIVSGVCGDTASIVTVTLETGIVYEYADETKINSAEDQSKTSSESEKTYITVKDSNGGETPLVITSYMPKIRGVSVICGADSAQAEEIKSAVCAALDISSRKIYIGRKTG